MRKTIRYLFPGLLAVSVVLLLAACRSQQAPPTTLPVQITPESAPTDAGSSSTTIPVSPATGLAPAPTVTFATPSGLGSAAENVQAGRALFAARGCAACHGPDAEGIQKLGPALAGHSREAVFKQVRTPAQVQPPAVQMPAFDPDRISDEELEAIAAFLGSLGPPMGAGEFAASLTEAAHLRLVAAVLKAGDVADARAHLQDLAASTSSEKKEKIAGILRLLEEGDNHEAEHELEMMLLQAPGSDRTPVQLHLILTLDALQRHGEEDAARHLEDAVSVAAGDEKTRLEAMLADLRAGKAQDVEGRLNAMLK